MNTDNSSEEDLKRANLLRVALKTPAGILAFGFGSGLSPLAPGTVGTVIAVPIAIALQSLPTAGFFIVLALMFLLGVKLCDRVSQQLGVHDHGGIVWDEIVGFCLSVAFIPLQWQWLLAAFVLFRFFDIYKPWPIRQLDEKVSGGFGIMLDDIAAAIYTMIVLAALQVFW
jgi:phosphatidylglycerophosphatase A